MGAAPPPALLNRRRLAAPARRLAATVECDLPSALPASIVADASLTVGTATDTLKRVTLELGGKSPSIVFADVDDAIAQANDTDYGLAASVWTRNLVTAHHMASAIEAGTVWINTWAEMSTGNLPFGGYKQSGLGCEGGPEGLDTYTRTKTVRIVF